MDLASIVIATCVIVGSTALSILGVYLVRKRVELSVLRSYHEVAGYLLSVIGTLYAVLLGFVVVDSMSKFDRARVLVEEEANGIANVFFLADNFPDKQRHEIHMMCLKYCDAVVNDEWTTMREGKPSKAAIEEIRGLWQVISRFEPANQNQQSLFEAMLVGMQEIATNRRLRIITALYGTSPVMIAVLVVGAIITVMFTYFFGLENLRTQVIMTGLVTVTLSLNLCLVLLYGFPFRTGVEVQPIAFKFDQHLIRMELNRHGELKDDSFNDHEKMLRDFSKISQ